MADFELIPQAYLDALRGMIRAGTKVDACEVLAIRLPQPAGTRYCAFAQFDEAPNFREGLAARGITVEVSKTTGYFLDLTLRDETEEDSVPVELLDHDGSATALIQTYGTGHQVEVYFYIAQINAFISVWCGHLRPPREGGGLILKCSASAGFRNAQVSLPRRVLFVGSCQAPDFGGNFATQAEIAASKGCGWNRHLGGTKGLPGSELLPPCQQSSRDECRQYWGDDLAIVSADTVVEAIVNFNRGVGNLAYSKGNESSLKDPLRVFLGARRKVRELEPSAYTPQVNTAHPDKGFVRVLIPVGEGPLRSVTECAVNDRLIGAEHLNVRRGLERQPRTGFSPNCSNMSWTAHFFGVWGQVDASQYTASNLRGSCKVEGLEDIRVYTDEVTYTETWTDLRSWNLMECLRNQRWGRGYLDERFVIADWLALAAWDAQTVKYKTSDDVEHTVRRSNFSAELVGRPGGQQISDICVYGRYGKPFRHNGKVRIVPLKQETIDDSIALFTDVGRDANIVRTSEGSQLFWSRIDDAELTNQIVLTFEDFAHDNVERPLVFSDRTAQKAAAAALGDRGIHVVEKPYSASGAGGITLEGEAIRVGYMLLNLGEFDAGGIQNNLHVWFTTNVFEALNLRPYQLIRIVSPKIAGFRSPQGNPFQYFRVMPERTRQGDLYAVIHAQAYNEAYYEQMESVEDPAILPGPVIVPNPGGQPGRIPETIGFDDVGHTHDRIYFRLQQSTFAP